MTSYVLVHGIAHDGWCWSPIEDRLVASGHSVSAVDLPLTSLEDDAAEVRRVLDAASGPVVLVGHSYGGLVISMAADGRTDVTHLVYVAALMLDAEELAADRFAEFPPATLAQADIFTDDGHLVIPREHAFATFYADCDPDLDRTAAERLRPTAMACLSTPVGAEPWRTIP